MRAWWILSVVLAGGCGQSDIDKAILRYETAGKAHDAAEQSRQARQVAAAYLQAGDSDAYVEWNIRAGTAATAATVERLGPTDRLDPD